MGYKLKKPVTVVGMMGAGKTAVGKSLAQRLGVPFVDSDAEIEAAAAMTIPEVFERDGEIFFRQRESEVIARLLAMGPMVLSTGGGAFLAERNREEISRAGVSLWLRADVELLWQRVRHKSTRPLLRTADPKRTLTDLYEARRDIYALADLVVDSHKSYSITTMTDHVIRVLLTRPDVLEEL
ncbi:shikimate kinase [Maritimibacter sp. DP1N21-5]|nr:shikimate kinase [Maritimibacter sp. DP1N21-5]